MLLRHKNKAFVSEQDIPCMIRTHIQPGRRAILSVLSRSSDDEDRQGEKVNQDGLDFGNYMKNPVVLWVMITTRRRSASLPKFTAMAIRHWPTASLRPPHSPSRSAYFTKKVFSELSALALSRAPLMTAAIPRPPKFLNFLLCRFWLTRSLSRAT